MILQTSFENLLFNSPHFTFWKDKNSIYLGCNQNFAELVGLSSPDDVIGKNDYDLNWGKGGAGAEIFILGDRKTMFDTPVIDEKECIAKSNNDSVVMLVNKRPLIDKQHRIVGLFGVGVDITQFLQPKRHFISNIRLSKRETECIYHLVRGKTAKQIAKELNLSPRTVESYLENLKCKLKCSNRAEIIEKAINDGWLKKM